MSYLGTKPSNQTPTYKLKSEFIATAGQTVFAPSAYTPGYIDVYRNGVKLGDANFTATNGTTVTLAQGASVGDLITFESVYLASIQNGIPATAGAVSTSLIADLAVTPAKMSQKMTLETARASTSGTSIDFTGIPSWVKRITVMFAGVSTNGASNPLIQIGDSGGIENTGYSSNGYFIQNAGATGVVTSTAGYIVGSGFSGNSLIATFVINLMDSSVNRWVISGTGSPESAATAFISTGVKALSTTLDRVRITTANGTDTFDAGSINILYEG